MALTTSQGKPSLMSLMTRHLVENTDTSFLRQANCWEPPILALAGEERSLLVRAGHAAAIVAIGRGVYAALVEQMRQQDGQAATTQHREALQQAVQVHRQQALLLEVTQLQADALAVPLETLNVLTETQQWLREGAGDLDSLHAVYCAAEYKRKQERARLRRTPNGRRRRGEWNAEKGVDASERETPEAIPLHFRWRIVCQLLTDLHGTPPEPSHG